MSNSNSTINKIDFLNLNKVLEDVQDNEIDNDLEDFQDTFEDTEDTEDTEDIEDELSDNEQQVLDLQESLTIELQDLKKFELIDRVVNLQENCFVTGLDNLVYYLKGKISSRQFSDNRYGVIGQVSIHDCNTSKDLVLGILLNDAFSMFGATRDYLRKSGYTSKQIEGMISEINKKYCCEIKFEAEVNKVAKKNQAERKAQALLELQRNKDVIAPKIKKFKF